MNDGAGPAPAGVRPAALGFILVTVALDTLSFGIVIPVLPFLIAGFLGGDLARAADVNGVFGIATSIIAVATGVKLFNWLFTMYGGRIRYDTPMLWSLGFIPTFVIGGKLSGRRHIVVQC